MEEFIVFDAHGSYVLDMRFTRDGIPQISHRITHNNQHELL